MAASRTALFLFVSAFTFGCGSSDSSPPKPPAPVLTIDDLLIPPESCALGACSELVGCEPKGYDCPALAPYDSLPHADACGKWDGKFPAINGHCKVSDPAADAAKYGGIDKADAATFILPTGQRAKAAGKVSQFTDYKGQYPTNVVPIAGTDLVVVIDGGIQEQSVRLVDVTKIGGADDPVVGREKFVGSTSVNYGAVVLAGTPLRLLVSGSAGSVVYAFTIDVAAKKLTRDATNDILIKADGRPKGGGLANAYLLSGLAASPDGRRLFVGTGNAPSGETPLFVVDLVPTSPTYKQVTATIPIAGREIFAITLHPADTEGRYLFVSSWDGSRIDVVDSTAAPATAVIKSIPVGKNPQAFTPIGTRYMAVVASDGDEISLLDTLPASVGEVLKIPVVAGTKIGSEGKLAVIHGYAPSGVAYDATAKRLYVSLAGLNAVASYDVTLPADGTAPTLAPSGMFRTEWWPTAIAVREDGSVVVVNGKGRGTGANPLPFKPSEGDITDRMRGSIQIVAAPDPALLSAGKTDVEAATDVGKLAGAPKVDCAGAPYDFPIPQTNTEGPSKLIKHVIFVVKENKTFDGVYGDMPGVEGDAKLVMAPGQMEQVFGNQRKVGKTFTNFDNYYTSAEQSIQGHVWTSFGRTTEYIERTWLVTWGRGFRGLPTAGITSVGRPVEGSIFDWLQREQVMFDNMGEPVGAAANDGKTPRNCCFDDRYPGKFYAMDKPDTEKGCYIAARARVSCDLKSFTYALHPNDHTSGGAAGKPTPQTYIAVGDEGLGVLLEGLSHSPMWAETLLIVTEDDPQDGGDHIDAHRTPLLMASPWIRHGYVSKGHYDTSSVHKLIAHIFGKPYPNEAVTRASLPLDAFSSTPDYTPFDRMPRTLPLACNSSGTKASTEAAMSKWDLSQPDQAPGLQKQVWELMHDGAPPPASFPDDDDD